LLIVRPRLGIAFGGIYGALVLLPFAAFTLLTRGGFYQHIVAFHSSWSAQHFLFLWEPFMARYWPLLLLSAVLPLVVLVTGLLTPRRLASLRADTDLVPALYLPIAAFFTLGAGTHGGNHNHFVETIVVAIFCTALLIGRLVGAQHRTLSWRTLTPSLLLLIALALGNEASFGGTNWLARDFRQPLPTEVEGWRNVAAFVTNDPGPVYADNVGLLLVAGKEVRYTDPFSLSYATRTGQWDDSALVARVERGEFSLIALRYDLFAPDVAGGGASDLTPGLYTAIRAQYRVIERNVMILYAPR